MIKKYLLCVAECLCLTVPVFAQKVSESVTESVRPVEGSFSRFDYQGFSMMIPSGSSVDMTSKEAIVKSNDGTFGMSVKVEKDKDASATAAVEMCRRMVSELDVRGAKVSRVMVHGMQGGRLEGMAEGAPMSVLILKSDDCYFKIVFINTPERADWVNICIDSVTRE